MQVKFKKLNKDAVIPTKAHPTDAGYDLVATSVSVDEMGNVVYGTGLSLEIPNGYVGLAFSRSSVSKKDLILSNCVGVIDAGYRGEIMFKFRPMNFGFKQNIKMPCSFWKRLFHPYDLTSDIVPYWSEGHGHFYKPGDRIAQLIIIPRPRIEFVECEELSDSDRGTGGFGSTGEK